MSLKRRIWSCIILLVLLALICLYGCVKEYGNTKEYGDARLLKAVSLIQQADLSGVEAKKIAITFDDGPDENYTQLLLDGLQKRSVKATFFVMGKKAQEYPEIVRRMSDEGHLVGNHTYTHMQLARGKEDIFRQELQKTSQVIEEITGESPLFVRPPFGTWDRKFENELNMFPVLWTIDPLDWCSDDADCVARNVIARAKENDIILMHDQYKSSVTAAFMIIDELQSQGYEFVTVDEILFD